ncbi:MAG TPA: SMP-30/gluconolactonase/LRE family protein [Bryobacteraceae bacterium]|nr:SMP-30/gluconolactonase/LRE family protein [Bryobacteraceae bacterium]
MRKPKSRWALTFGLVIYFSLRCLAHPASGIILDSQGQIYFADAARGVYLIKKTGDLIRYSAQSEHWLALDSQGRFSESAELTSASNRIYRITPERAIPAILLTSGAPITIGADGDLYYAAYTREGPLQVMRRTPQQESLFVRIDSSADGQPLHWINGICTGPDGSLYFTENDAVRKISRKGRISTVVSHLQRATGPSVPGIRAELGPYLRGLAVDTNGNIWVAATGECAVLKITSAGQVTTVLKTQSPWSPTGIAVSGGDVYSLEYFHTATDIRTEWYPRVRKQSSDGKVITLANLQR